jgi:hypothetical protein
MSVCCNNLLEGKQMPVRVKKFIGIFIMIVLVIVYAMTAVTVATYRLAESPWYIHMAYFLVTGLLWVLPAMWLIKWMETPPKSKASDAQD